MPGPDPRKAKLMQGPQARGRQSDRKNKKDDIKFIEDADGNKIFIKTIEGGKDGIQTVDMKAKGGRVGLKSGSKGCKLAMKGKGRAYGKNS